jgi:hypothetical protein
MRENLKREKQFHSFDEIINHCLFTQLLIDVEFLVREKTRKKNSIATRFQCSSTFLMFTLETEAFLNRKY